MKSKQAVLCALCAFVLALSSCRVKVLKPDAPDDACGVGRAEPSQTDDVSGTGTAGDSADAAGKTVYTAPVEDPESLAPFGGSYVISRAYQPGADYLPFVIGSSFV